MGTYYLNTSFPPTRFPMRTLLCEGYNVNLKKCLLISTIFCLFSGHQKALSSRHGQLPKMTPYTFTIKIYAELCLLSTERMSIRTVRRYLFIS